MTPITAAADEVGDPSFYVFAFLASVAAFATLLSI